MRSPFNKVGVLVKKATLIYACKFIVRTGEDLVFSQVRLKCQIRYIQWLRRQRCWLIIVMYTHLADHVSSINVIIYDSSTLNVHKTVVQITNYTLDALEQ